MIVTPAEALASVARPPAARQRRTLTELAQGFLRWLDAHHRPQTTIASYGDGLGAFLAFATGVGMVYPDQVTVLSLDGYYVWLRSRGKSANTMAHRRSVLIAFWKWLEHEGFAERNVPAKTYPIKTPKRLPTSSRIRSTTSWSSLARSRISPVSGTTRSWPRSSHPRARILRRACRSR